MVLIRLFIGLACFWSKLLQIFPTEKWMVLADIFLWYSQFLRIWGHKICILDLVGIPWPAATPNPPGSLKRGKRGGEFYGLQVDSLKREKIFDRV